MKPSKYKAVRTTVDGVTFASKAEAKRVKAKSLGIRKAGWPKSKWKRKINGETVLR